MAAKNANGDADVKGLHDAKETDKKNETGHGMVGWLLWLPYELP